MEHETKNELITEGLDGFNWRILNPPNSDRYFIVDEFGHWICEFNYGDKEQNANIIIQSILAHKKVIELSKVVKELLDVVGIHHMHHSQTQPLYEQIKRVGGN